MRLRVSILFVFLSFVLIPAAFAQPTLPDIAGATDKGINVISWNCQYDGIKSIAVQRSGDSVYNFTTVGFVKNLKKGPQAFIDGHPMPGDNWYRLYIVFGSDLTWYSNPTKLEVDSAAILNTGVLPPNDSLQKLATNIKIDTMHSVPIELKPIDSVPLQNVEVPVLKEEPHFVVTIPDPGDISAYSYIKSQFVYTNPFTGHVNLELPDVKEHHYSVIFFDQQDNEVLDIPNVFESKVIIDKRNFKRKGIYKFELRQDRNQLETGFITIY